MASRTIGSRSMRSPSTRRTSSSSLVSSVVLPEYANSSWTSSARVSSIGSRQRAQEPTRGAVTAPLVGSCARCLDPIEDTLELDVQELFAYSGSTTEETSDEDEVRLVEGERIDLEPMVRDAVVLSLPLAPVCDEDCAGLCAECGQRWDDLPDDHSHEQLDPRWAGLAAKLTPTPSSPGTPGEQNQEEN
jgi:uncharacterized metal-binding protein YceD (DUF177 family)